MFVFFCLDFFLDSVSFEIGPHKKVTLLSFFPNHWKLKLFSNSSLSP